MRQPLIKALALRAVVLPLLLACSEARGPVAIVRVQTTSGLVGGKDINRLTLEVTPRLGSPLPLRSYPVSSTETPSPGTIVFPAELEIRRTGDRSDVLTIEATGFSGDQKVVSRKIKLPYYDYPVTVPLDLDLICAARECPEGQTCLPRLGCKGIPEFVTEAPAQPKLPPAGPACEPGAPAADADVFNGPVCDCERFFPMCVGATWGYAIQNPNTPAIVWCKTFAIGDSMCTGPEQAQLPAFRQIRKQSIGERASRWLVLDGSRLYWKKDALFDATWAPLLTKEYTPPKLRLDEALTADLTGPLLVPYVVSVRDEPDDLESTDDHHDDTWTVVSLDTIVPTDQRTIREHIKKDPGIDGGPTFVATHPQDFRLDETSPPEAKDIVCHHRSDQAVTIVDGVRQPSGQSTEATFCFARGIGKIWELTENVSEEWLRSFDVPGCRQSEPNVRDAGFAWCPILER